MQRPDTFDETYFLPDLCNQVEMEHLRWLHKHSKNTFCNWEKGFVIKLSYKPIQQIIYINTSGKPGRPSIPLLINPKKLKTGCKNTNEKITLYRLTWIDMFLQYNNHELHYTTHIYHYKSQ